MRKTVQVVVLDGQLVVLCDDGTLFVQNGDLHGSCRWSLIEVPQAPVQELRHEASSEETADRLVADELIGRESGAKNGEESVATARMKSPARTAAKSPPVRSAPAEEPAVKTPPVRSAPAEEPAPAPAWTPAPTKTKPKRPLDEEDAQPRVAAKYWVMLGICAVALGGYWLSTMSFGSMRTVAVSGKVTLNGAPLHVGVITFAPDESQGNTHKVSGRGKIKEDGTYRLEAPLGKYKVSVSTMSPANPGAVAPELPRRYTDPRRSPLAADVVDDPKGGAYDFALEDKSNIP